MATPISTYDQYLELMAELDLLMQADNRTPEQTARINEVVEVVLEYEKFLVAEIENSFDPMDAFRP